MTKFRVFFDKDDGGSSSGSSSSNKSSSTSRPSSGGASGDSSQTPSTKTSSSSTPTRTRQAEVTTTNKDSKGNTVSKTTSLNDDGKTSSSKSGSSTKKYTTADRIKDGYDSLGKDRNSDGKTSFGEVIQNAGDGIKSGISSIGDGIKKAATNTVNAFKGQDYDGDGKTSISEWGRNFGESLSKGLGGKDFNNDGRYSLGETFKGGVDKIQSKLGGVDYNQDGTIDTGETVDGILDQSTFGENTKALLGGYNSKDGGAWDKITSGIGAGVDTVSSLSNPMTLNSLRSGRNAIDALSKIDYDSVSSTSGNEFQPATNNKSSSSSDSKPSDWNMYLEWLVNNPGKSYQEYKTTSDMRTKDFIVRGMGPTTMMGKMLRANLAMDMKDKLQGKMPKATWTPNGIVYN